MMRSLFSGVSGLKNHQTRMDVLGNNIANVNTTGFKQSRVTFQDMLSQTIRGGTTSTSGGAGGINPAQVGLGMLVGSIDTLHTQGNLQSTGKSTDMAIQGNGFFVLSDGVYERYSRDGAFDIADDGTLVNPSNGYRVQGWMADTDGTITVSPTVGIINIPIGQTDIAQATSTASLAGNLDSDATAATKGSVALSGTFYSDAAHSTLAVGTTALTSLYDSAGNRVLNTGDVLTLGATKGDVEYEAAAKTVGATGFTTLADLADWMQDYLGIASGETYDYSGASVTSGVSITAGKLTVKGNLGSGNDISALSLVSGDESGSGFDANFSGVATSLRTAAQEADGTSVSSTMTVYDSQGAAHDVRLTYTKTGSNTWSWTADCADNYNASRCVTNDGAMKSLTFGASGSYGSATGSITIDLNGAADLAVAADMSSLTQLSGSSNVKLSAQNGYPQGTLDEFSIGSDGVITGIYTNGMTKRLAQIAVATFNNAGGLLKEGNNVFAQSTNSGTAQKGVAGESGSGTISNGVLEMSNVDLAQSFTDMIITQRGFQANAKIITTSDQMLAELVNLKQ